MPEESALAPVVNSGWTIFKMLCDEIQATCEVPVGATGYLDGRVEPIAPVTKGIDKWGRHHITLCLRSEGKDDRETYECAGIITIFQRYTGQTTVTQANNGERRAPLIPLSGAMTMADMLVLQQLVLTGKASRVVPNVIGGTLHETFTLVHPESVNVTRGSQPPKTDLAELAAVIAPERSSLEASALIAAAAGALNALQVAVSHLETTNEMLRREGIIRKMEYVEEKERIDECHAARCALGEALKPFMGSGA